MGRTAHVPPRSPGRLGRCCSCSGSLVLKLICVCVSILLGSRIPPRMLGPALCSLLNALSSALLLSLQILFPLPMIDLAAFSRLLLSRDLGLPPFVLVTSFVADFSGASFFTFVLFTSVMSAFGPQDRTAAHLIHNN